ncbi:MAG: sulfatase-like hydrolase/transferase [Myxococcales bacterium]|nr:sulfatase-like hydrolase/transferase [Myxococcales bacterium]
MRTNPPSARQRFFGLWRQPVSHPVALGFLALFGTGCVMALTNTTLRKAPLSVDVGVMLVSVSVVIVATQWWLYLLLDRLAKSGTWRGLIAAATSLAMAALLRVDVLSHQTFGTHLNLAQVRQMAESVIAGEVAVPMDLAVGLGAATAIWFFAIPPLLAIFSRRDVVLEAGHGPRRVYVELTLLALMLVALRGLVVDSAAPEVKAVHNVVPWEPPIPAHATAPLGCAAAILNQDLSDRTELAQMQALKKQQKARIAGLPKPTRTPNVLMVHVESLRADMLNATDMPKLFARSRSCYVAKHHFSSGNSSTIGMWGFVSGLNAMYHHATREAALKPVPLAILGKLGYQRKVWFSKDIRAWDKTWARLYQGRSEGYYQAKRGAQLAQEKELLSTLVKRMADWPKAQKRFDMLVLYASHYPYYHPEETAPNQPEVAEEFGLESGWSEEQRPHRAKIFNRYKNAVRFIDDQLAELFTGLEQSGRLGNTIVMIAGDHGEEFWEKGRFGHIYGLNDEQVAVPMVMCAPGKQPKSMYEVSSHADLMPTVFDFMGLGKATAWATNGKSLLTFDPARDFAIIGHGLMHKQHNHRYAVVGSGLKVHFDNVGRLKPLRITDPYDEELESIPDDTVVALLRKAAASKDRLAASKTKATAASNGRLQELTTLAAAFTSPPAQLWSGPVSERGEASAAELRKVHWRLVTYGPGGKERSQVNARFLSEDALEAGGHPTWHKWRITGEQLLISDRHAAPVAVLSRHPRQQRLVGRAPTGELFVLTPGSVAIESQLSPVFWPKSQLSASIGAGDLTAQPWGYRWFLTNDNYGGGREVTFLPNGRIGEGQTNNWTSWQLDKGALKIIDRLDQLVVRFAYDPGTRRLVGRTRRGETYTLNAKWDRSKVPLPAIFWPEGTQATDLDVTTLTAKPWSYSYHVLTGKMLGERQITFGTDGSIAGGRTAFWHSWRLNKGRLILHNKKGETVCTFSFDKAGKRLVGWGKSGDVLLLKRQKIGQ